MAPLAVLGIGGRGCSAIEYLRYHGPAGLRLMAANTDSRPLARNASCAEPSGRLSVAPPAVQWILLGDGGQGAGGNAARGRRAAELDAADIRAALTGVKQLLIVVGLGGGTGSGAAPVAARIAQELGAAVYVVASLPFSWEGRDRALAAAAALQALREQGCPVDVMPNDDLLGLDEDISQEDAFAHADAQVAAIAMALADGSATVRSSPER